MEFEWMMMRLHVAALIEGVSECLKDDPDQEGYTDLIHALDDAKRILRMLKKAQRLDSQD